MHRCSVDCLSTHLVGVSSAKVCKGELIHLKAQLHAYFQLDILSHHWRSYLGIHHEPHRRMHLFKDVCRSSLKPWGILWKNHHADPASVLHQPDVDGPSCSPCLFWKGYKKQPQDSFWSLVQRPEFQKLYCCFNILLRVIHVLDLSAFACFDYTWFVYTAIYRQI